ncbi:YchJ family protein [Gordonia sp. NPDC003950]
MRTVDRDARCPCTSGLTFEDCCGPVLAGRRRAPTAEALMRSRFTAFAVGDGDHLMASWHRSTRPADVDLDDTIDWYRLDVLDTVGGGPFDTTGQVRFTAFYRGPGGRATMTEHSRFERVDGSWFYLDGDQL